jgi:UDP-3-O-[3-hydroxymyristoyl] glucosamine N-acyltransferase
MQAIATLGEIAASLGGELIGDPRAAIDAVGPLDAATPTTIAFLANPLYEKQLAGSRAGCVIVGPAFREAAVARGATIVTPDPYLYFARLTQWWAARTRPRPAPGVHPSALVDTAAEIAGDASVGAFAVVEAGASLGAGVVVGAHAFVGRDCRIGAASRLAPRTTLMFGTTLGERCFVQAGAVLGGDGFGFAPAGGRWEKIEQLGRVVLGNDVEVGANTCIDRGAAGDTVIGDGVKIDNLVQIGHNVKIGAHTAIAGCVGVAGSTTIGAHCMIGGGVGISGHISIADRVVITGATQVTRTIAKAGVYSGPFPFDDNASWEKNAATLRNLYGLRERVRALEKKQT